MNKIYYHTIRDKNNNNINVDEVQYLKGKESSSSTLDMGSVRKCTFVRSSVCHFYCFWRFWASLVSSVIAACSLLYMLDTRGTDLPQMAKSSETKHEKCQYFTSMTTKHLDDQSLETNFWNSHLFLFCLELEFVSSYCCQYKPHISEKQTNKQKNT